MNNKLVERKLHNETESELYHYDSRYRLTRFERGTVNASNTTISVASTNQPLHSNWILDGVGNWRNVDYESRKHNSFNEIIQRTVTLGTNTGSFALQYDHNGNLTDDGFYIYQYDYKNRLVRVTRRPNNTFVARYTYDARGRRVEKIAGPFVFQSLSWDGWREIEEVDSDTSIPRQTLRQYVYGNYVDERILMDVDINGDDIANGAGDQRLFYHQNTLYSVFALTDTTGKIVEGCQYDAYGQATIFGPSGDGVVHFGSDENLTGTSFVGNSCLFTGRRLDSETRLYYCRTRYLNPALGRYITMDARKHGRLRVVFSRAKPSGSRQGGYKSASSKGSSSAAGQTSSAASTRPNNRNLPAYLRLTSPGSWSAISLTGLGQSFS